MRAMSGQSRINVASLKKTIIEATATGSGLSRRKLSLLASDGKNPDLVRDLLSRGQDRKVSIETAAGLARALGRELGDFLMGEVLVPAGPIRIKVVGEVEAGAWRENGEWDEDQIFEIEVTPSPFGATGRFGLRVVGFSMDKLFLPGTILDCFQVYGSDGLVPEPGDVVIVQRCRGDLIETTCKRLERLADGGYQLRAESTRPEFQDPIALGKPDGEYFGDDETRVIGIVNAAVTPVFRRGMN